jgi:hypothetical protein
MLLAAVVVSSTLSRRSRVRSSDVSTEPRYQPEWCGDQRPVLGARSACRGGSTCAAATWRSGRCQSCAPQFVPKVIVRRGALQSKGQTHPLQPRVAVRVSISSRRLCALVRLPLERQREGSSPAGRTFRRTARGHPGPKRRGPAAAQPPDTRPRTRLKTTETPAIEEVSAARPEGLDPVACDRPRPSDP